MPTRIINPLLLLLVTASRGQLAKQIQYLKSENEVLRARLPEHIRATRAVRAKLLKFGKPLGSTIQDNHHHRPPPDFHPLGHYT